MLKRKKIKSIKIKNECYGDYSDMDSRWLRADNKTGLFEDLINVPEGCLIVWSMYEDGIYSLDDSLNWVRLNSKEIKRAVRGK